MSDRLLVKLPISSINTTALGQTPLSLKKCSGRLDTAVENVSLNKRPGRRLSLDDSSADSDFKIDELRITCSDHRHGTGIKRPRLIISLDSDDETKELKDKVKALEGQLSTALERTKQLETEKRQTENHLQHMVVALESQLEASVKRNEESKAHLDITMERIKQLEGKRKKAKERVMNLANEL